MKKRIIAFVTAFVLISSVSLFFSFGASADMVADDDYKNKKDLLLAVCPDMPAGDEGTYTRAEFTAAVTELLAMPAPGETAGFSDVPAGHRYAENIDMAVSIGLVNSQNMFYPDDPITYVQAIKIVTTAIGYNIRADVMGGYPTGYLLAAKEADIATGISFLNDSPLSYADGISILYDMMLADILQMTALGDSVEYNTVEGENILSVYYDINIYEGIVNANEFTGLYNKNNYVGDGKIQIESTVFSGSEFYNLIGQRVKAFYRDDPSRTIIRAYGTENEIHRFNTENTLGLSGLNLTVTPSEKTAKEQKYTLDSGYTVIHNGKKLALGDYTSYLNPDAGRVTIIDNDDNGIFDVISIEEIKYGFIEKVNVLGKKIYDKYKSSLFVDMSDPDTKYFIYDADGAELTLDDIEENTVAGYIMSDDKKFIKINIYDNAYGGIIEEKTSDGKVKIRDRYCTLSDYYLGLKTLNELPLGSEVICYLGENDDIVYMEFVSGDTNYAFIVDVGMETAGIEKSISLKLMTSTDAMIVMDLADKVNVNGTILEKSLAYDPLKIIRDGEDKYRVIKFKLNNEGKINKILSAECVNNLSDIYDETVENDRPKAFLTDDDESINSYYIEGILSPFFVLSASTSIIMIPKNAADKLVDKNYEVIESTSFQTTSYEVMAYDVDAGGVPKFVVVYTSSSLTSVGEYTKYAIVEKKYTTIDSEGDVVDCLKVFMGGSYQMFYITDTTPGSVKTILSAVAPGDMVRLAYNSGNEILNAMHDFDISAKTVFNTEDTINADIKNTEFVFNAHRNGYKHEYIHGYIYGLSGTYARVVPESEGFTGVVSTKKSIIINLGRGTTVFVKINKDRQGNVIDAEVFTEADYSSVETIVNAGSKADYIVTMQRFRQSGTNVIYYTD